MFKYVFHAYVSLLYDLNAYKSLISGLHFTTWYVYISHSYDSDSLGGIFTKCFLSDGKSPLALLQFQERLNLLLVS